MSSTDTIQNRCPVSENEEETDIKTLQHPVHQQTKFWTIHAQFCGYNNFNNVQEEISRFADGTNHIAKKIFEAFPEDEPWRINFEFFGMGDRQLYEEQLKNSAKELGIPCRIFSSKALQSASENENAKWSLRVRFVGDCQYCTSDEFQDELKSLTKNALVLMDVETSTIEDSSAEEVSIVPSSTLEENETFGTSTPLKNTETESMLEGSISQSLFSDIEGSGKDVNAEQTLSDNVHPVVKFYEDVLKTRDDTRQRTKMRRVQELLNLAGEQYGGHCGQRNPWEELTDLKAGETYVADLRSDCRFDSTTVAWYLLFVKECLIEIKNSSDTSIPTSTDFKTRLETALQFWETECENQLELSCRDKESAEYRFLHNKVAFPYTEQCFRKLRRVFKRFSINDCLNNLTRPMENAAWYTVSCYMIINAKYRNKCSVGLLLHITLEDFEKALVISGLRRVLCIRGNEEKCIQLRNVDYKMWLRYYEFRMKIQVEEKSASLFFVNSKGKSFEHDDDFKKYLNEVSVVLS